MQDISIFEKKSKTGLPVPCVNIKGKIIRLYSLQDPEKASSRFLKSLKADKYSIFVFLGLGYAYHLKESIELLLKKNDIKIYIVEYYKEFLDIIENKGIAPFLHSHNIRILTGNNIEFISNKIISNFSILSSIGIELIPYIPSIGLNPKFYKELSIAIKKKIDKKTETQLTIAKFGKLWIKNGIENTMICETHGDINSIRNILKGNDVLLIAASPSLNSQIEIIKKIIDRIIIFCVDTSYPVLKKYRIIPDFILSVDPQQKSFLHFNSKNQNSDSILIADICSPRIIIEKFEKKFFIRNNNPFSEFIVKNIAPIPYKGSVTVAAINLIKSMGAKRLFIAGNDLCFPNGRLYATGSGYEKYFMERTNRFFNLGSIYQNYIIARSKQTKDKVHTSRLLLSYKEAIDNAAFSLETYMLEPSFHNFKNIIIINNDQLYKKLKFNNNEIKNKIKSLSFNIKMVNNLNLLKQSIKEKKSPIPIIDKRLTGEIFDLCLSRYLLKDKDYKKAEKKTKKYLFHKLSEIEMPTYTI